MKVSAAVLLVCSVAGCTAAVEEDVDVMLSRDVDVQSAAEPWLLSQLFPGGMVRYFVETNTSDSTGVAPLASDDVRIKGAVLEWETRTCIRFERCATEEECAIPYIRFISHKSSCSSYVGAQEFPNRIRVRESCGMLSLVHEIGHALGLKHEQSRRDRDEYVNVDLDRVKSGSERNFALMRPQGRDLGPYNYKSFMHYSELAFTTGGITIEAPQHIGQRTHMTDLDAEGVQFLYSYCQAVVEEPLCVASKDETATLLIPHSEVFNVDFNVNYGNRTVVVLYEGTTIPEGLLEVNYEAGEELVEMNFTNMSFVPTQAHAGETYTLSTTFTGDEGTSATCAVVVQVADADTVCFGISGSDPRVCSGHGNCTASHPSVCACEPGFGGVDCSGLETCPNNYKFSFDEENLGFWKLSDFYEVEADIGHAAVGDGSLRVGTMEGASGEYGIFDPLREANPNKVTLYMSSMEHDNLPSFYLRYGTRKCVELHMDRTGEWEVGSELTGVRYQRNRFYYVDIRMDWAAHTSTIYADGVLLMRDAPMDSRCLGHGINRVRYSGKGWMDEFAVWCTNYVVLSGSLADGSTEDELRTGGAMLTLTLVGGSDTWVQTEEAKLAIIKSLVSDTPLPTGWNSMLNEMITTDLVSFTAGGKQVVVGPLNPSLQYETQGDEGVYVKLTGDMFTSGTAPDQEPKELFFRVLGSCHANDVISFDHSTEAVNATIFTNVTAAGAGALILETPSWRTAFKPNVIRADSASVFVRVLTLDASVQVDVVSTTGDAIEILLADNSTDLQHRVGTNEWDIIPDVLTVGVYQKIAFDFNWAERLYAVSVDGVVLGSGVLPETMVAVASLGVQAQQVSPIVIIDEVVFGCANRAPVFSVAPCPVPGQVGATLEMHEGTHPLRAEDRIALVPQYAQDCSDVERHCDRLEACSNTTGLLSLVADNKLQWTMGLLKKLRYETSYGVCYYSATTQTYELLQQTVTTCARQGCPWKGKHGHGKGKGKGKGSHSKGHGGKSDSDSNSNSKSDSKSKSKSKGHSHGKGKGGRGGKGGKGGRGGRGGRRH